MNTENMMLFKSLHELLSTSGNIVTKEIIGKVARLLPDKMSSRIRFTPRPDAHSVLNHLFSVIDIAINKNFNDSDYVFDPPFWSGELIAVEGIGDVQNGPADIILEGAVSEYDDDFQFAYDLTFDPKLLDSKKKLMSKVYPSHYGGSILSTKTLFVTTDISLNLNNCAEWMMPSIEISRLYMESYTAWKMYNRHNSDGDKDCLADRVLCSLYDSVTDKLAHIPVEDECFDEPLLHDVKPMLKRNNAEMAREFFHSMRSSKYFKMSENLLKSKYAESNKNMRSGMCMVGPSEGDSQNLGTKDFCIQTDCDLLYCVHEVFEAGGACIKVDKHGNVSEAGRLVNRIKTSSQNVKSFDDIPDIMFIGRACIDKVDDEKVASMKYFQAYMNPDLFKDDLHFKSMLQRRGHDPNRADKVLDEQHQCDDSNYMQWYIDLEKKLEIKAENLSHYVSDVDGSIYSKLDTLSKKCKIIDSMDNSKNDLMMKYIDTIRNTAAANILAHEFEVANTILASGMTDRDINVYYFSKNGPYKSYTLVQYTGKVESFTTAHFRVYYAQSFEASEVRTLIKLKNNMVCTEFRSWNTNTLTHSLKLPYMYMSAAIYELENSRDISNHALDELVMPFLIGRANNGPFAASSEQTRYIIVGNLGTGNNQSKVTEKMIIIAYKSEIMALYTFRQMKMLCLLGELNNTNQLMSIVDKKANRLEICPPSRSFMAENQTHLVNSIYYCNFFNKVKADALLAVAGDYLALYDELKIFESVLENNTEQLRGVPDFIDNAILKLEHKPFWKAVSLKMHDIVNWITSLLNVKKKRFVVNILWQMAMAVRHKSSHSVNYQSMYKRIGKSMIKNCTLRSGMTDIEPITARQRASAINVISEHTVRLLMSIEMSHSIASNFITGSALELDCSLLNLSVIQFCNSNYQTYACRITDKDQIGFREISSLNGPYRVDALLIEVTAEESTLTNEMDVLMKTTKDKTITELFMMAFCDSGYDVSSSRKRLNEVKDKPFSAVDSIDRSRWGPNVMVNTYIAFDTIIYRDDPGMVKLRVQIYINASRKIIKFPEDVISWVQSKNSVIKDSRTDMLAKFYRTFSNDILMGKAGITMAFGMLMGIFHRESSTHNALVSRTTNDVIMQAAWILTRRSSMLIRVIVTSDDSMRMLRHNIQCTQKVRSMIVAKDRMVNLISNIIRSDGKSESGDIMAEMNQIYCILGVVISASFKQRVANIGFQEGKDWVSDVAGALSAGADYLRVGGSLLGADLLQLMNISLCLEQWKMWDMMNKMNSYYFPVELFGIPVISSVMTMIAGIMGVRFFTIRDLFMVSKESYINYIMMSEPKLEKDPNTFSFSDIGSTVTKHLMGMSGILFNGPVTKLVKNADERSHMSEWEFEDKYLDLTVDYPRLGTFLKHLERTTKRSTVHKTGSPSNPLLLLVRSWSSVNKKHFKIPEFHPLKVMFSEVNMEGTMSREDISSVLLKINTMLKADNSKMSERMNLIEKSNHCMIHYVSSCLIRSFSTAMLVDDMFSSMNRTKSDINLPSVAIRNLDFNLQTLADPKIIKAAMIKSMCPGESEMMIRRNGIDYDSLPDLVSSGGKGLEEALNEAESVSELINKWLVTHTKVWVKTTKMNIDIKTFMQEIVANQSTYDIRWDLEMVNEPDMLPTFMPSTNMTLSLAIEEAIRISGNKVISNLMKQKIKSELIQISSETHPTSLNSQMSLQPGSMVMLFDKITDKYKYSLSLLSASSTLMFQMTDDSLHKFLASRTVLMSYVNYKECMIKNYTAAFSNIRWNMKGKSGKVLMLLTIKNDRINEYNWTLILLSHSTSNAINSSITFTCIKKDLNEMGYIKKVKEFLVTKSLPATVNFIQVSNKDKLNIVVLSNNQEMGFKQYGPTIFLHMEEVQIMMPSFKAKIYNAFDCNILCFEANAGRAMIINTIVISILTIPNIHMKLQVFMMEAFVESDKKIFIKLPEIMVLLKKQTWWNLITSSTDEDVIFAIIISIREMMIENRQTVSVFSSFMRMLNYMISSMGEPTMKSLCNLPVLFSGFTNKRYSQSDRSASGFTSLGRGCISSSLPNTPLESKKRKRTFTESESGSDDSISSDSESDEGDDTQDYLPMTAGMIENDSSTNTLRATLLNIQRHFGIGSHLSWMTLMTEENGIMKMDELVALMDTMEIRLMMALLLFDN